MKTYIYNFRGVFLEGFMYVKAENRTEADELFKEELPEYLHHKNILSDGRLVEQVTVIEIKRGKRAYLIMDGDY